MQLRAWAGGAVASDACARSRNACARPPPIRAPRPSFRQSRRVSPLQFLCRLMVSLLPACGLALSTLLTRKRENKRALILEYELGRVQQRPENILGRLAPRDARLAEHLQAHAPLLRRRQPAVGQQINLFDDLTRRHLARSQFCRSPGVVGRFLV